MSLRKNLRIIFDETTTAPHLKSLSFDRRYIARSLDGGAGWGVWDRKAERFLKDREVGALSLEAVRQPMVTN